MREWEEKEEKGDVGRVKGRSGNLICSKRLCPNNNFKEKEHLP